jgi:hypothetical protein
MERKAGTGARREGASTMKFFLNPCLCGKLVQSCANENTDCRCAR